ncbi:MAG TPA: hypothetical protein VLZ12_05475 [Verrucomicrobiae bacterium]|nr:hypothetical protein [Verrucomicrobiae bacterium]
MARPPTQLAKSPIALAGLALLIMAGLMLGPITQETATVDETTYMGGGYAYFRTGSAKMAEEQPLLLQMILAAPLLLQDVHISEAAQDLMEQRSFSPLAWRWTGGIAGRLEQVFPEGVNWYHFGLPEAQYFGQILVYDPQNKADRLMLSARLVALLLTIGAGAFLFYWTVNLTHDTWASLMATVLWAFNPVALAYGHLAITEPGISLAFPAAVWWFGRTLRNPSFTNAILLGILMALALELKIVGVLLWPFFAFLLVALWIIRRKESQTGFLALSFVQLLRRVALVVAGFWGAILIIYFPHWSAPPPIAPAQAEVLKVPDWFVTLRPLLVPGNFFKSVTLKTLHSQSGADSFLMGKWSARGWRYYYPLAFWFKTPIPLLALTVIAAGLLLRRSRQIEFPSLLPWLMAIFFMLVSLISTINLGVRHVYPVYPLLAVGVADQVARVNRRWRVGAWFLCGWLIIIAISSYPFYIPYCNEFAGGTSGGYKCLIDSNYDWGQDGERLKAWVEKNHVQHIYLDYFGTQASIEWLKIPNTRVDAERARQLRDGWLVVSVSQLMRPEWAWLRESRKPDTRIAYTLFVYRLT